MIISISIFFVVYLSFVGLMVYIGYLMQKAKELKYRTETFNIDPSEITVLIPFRNEEKNLVPLLRSILNLKLHPGKIIFINDHSSDDSVEKIEAVLADIDHSILFLPKGETGKKRALRFGAREVDSRYTLTLDADVVLAENYFERLKVYQEADMYVLPVDMTPSIWWQQFFCIDHLLASAVNTGLSGLARPIMASGANLLYKTERFKNADNFESHAHIASGDDTYLLRDFRMEKYAVRLLADHKLRVQTETPKDFKEFIDQRLRWLGKTKDLKDHMSSSVAIIQIVLTACFVGLLIWMASKSEWGMFYLVLGSKIISDMVFFFPYFKQMKRLGSWLFIPIYEFLFPVYNLILLILIPFYKPKWKGREIYH